MLCNVPAHYTKKWHITNNWYTKPANWYPKPETRTSVINSLPFYWHVCKMREGSTRDYLGDPYFDWVNNHSELKMEFLIVDSILTCTLYLLYMSQGSLHPSFLSWGSDTLVNVRRFWHPSLCQEVLTPQFMSWGSDTPVYVMRFWQPSFCHEVLTSQLLSWGSGTPAFRTLIATNHTESNFFTIRSNLHIKPELTFRGSKKFEQKIKLIPVGIEHTTLIITGLEVRCLSSCTNQKCAS